MFISQAKRKAHICKVVEHKTDQIHHLLVQNYSTTHDQTRRGKMNKKSLGERQNHFG